MACHLVAIATPVAFSLCAATVDDSLPFILNILLAYCASLAGIATVLCLTQASRFTSVLAWKSKTLGGRNGTELRSGLCAPPCTVVAVARCSAAVLCAVHLDLALTFTPYSTRLLARSRWCWRCCRHSGSPTAGCSATTGGVCCLHCKYALCCW